MIRDQYRGACFLRALSPMAIALPHGATHAFGQSDAVALDPLLDKIIASITVANTAAETDLYRKTIAANQLGANGVVHLTIWGTHLNNTATPDTWRIKVKLGTTIVLDTTAIALGQSTQNYHWRADVWIWNAGATGVQRVAGWLTITSAGFIFPGFLLEPPTSATTAIPGFALGADGAATEDTTAARDLAVTVQHQTANAAITTVTRDAALEFFN